MLKWDIDNGVISKLYLNGVNYIRPWGAETADSSAFFSLEKNVGYRFEYLKNNHESNDQKNAHDLRVKMKEGEWTLTTLDEIIDEKTLKRKMELTCIEDSYLMDFVLRYRFLKKHFEYAEINDKKYIHANTNVYNQFPVKKVFLKGNDHSIKISIDNYICHDNFTPEMYIRDRGDEWIVHVRMFPKKSDKDVIKLCNYIFQTRPLPKILTKLILKSKKMKDVIWYRGEKKPYRNKIIKLLNPNAFALVKVKKDEKLMWNVKMEIV